MVFNQIKKKPLGGLTQRLLLKGILHLRNIHFKGVDFIF